MGGDITVSSQVGIGSSFLIEIPIEVTDAATVVPAAEPARTVIGLAPEHGEVRILNVDDKDANRLLISELLTALGFVVRDAVNGLDAVHVFGTWQPRLILMDMHMPVMDGYEAIKQIRALPNGADVTVVALTASAFEEDRRRILDTGANAYMRKPFKQEELFACIQQSLGLEYRYGDDEREAPRHDSGDTESTLLDRSAVQALPAGLLDQMRNAVSAADLDQFMLLVNQIDDTRAGIMDGLRGLCERFAYDALQDLLQPDTPIAQT
jgi:CheY-like chemotaxis protein